MTNAQTVCPTLGIFLQKFSNPFFLDLKYLHLISFSSQLSIMFDEVPFMPVYSESWEWISRVSQFYMNSKSGSATLSCGAYRMSIYCCTATGKIWNIFCSYFKNVPVTWFKLLISAESFTETVTMKIMLIANKLNK